MWVGSILDAVTLPNVASRRFRAKGLFSNHVQVWGLPNPRRLLFTDCTTDSNPKWRKYQFFTLSSWPGGVFASPSLAGSRPGALIAGAWAAILHTGREGYLKSCKDIVGAARKIVAGIKDIEELTILGEPKLTVVAFKSDVIDVYQVGDNMSANGWHCMCAPTMIFISMGDSVKYSACSKCTSKSAFTSHLLHASHTACGGQLPSRSQASSAGSKEDARWISWG